VSSVAFGAAADGLVVLDLAIGAHSAYCARCAWISALQVEARLASGAILVLCALRIAALERIAKEIGRAGTHGAVIHNAAVGVDTAHGARISAAEVDAGPAGAALAVRLAFTATAI